jgi:hypothetical protein
VFPASEAALHGGLSVHWKRLRRRVCATGWNACRVRKMNGFRMRGGEGRPFDGCNRPSTPPQSVFAWLANEAVVGREMRIFDSCN